MSDTHELKSLQVRREKLLAESKQFAQEIERIRKQKSGVDAEISMLEQRIESMTEREPVVTEHAMLRYVERVMGIDLNGIKNSILTEQNRKMIAFAGSCRIKSGNVEFVVKDRRVISVVG